MTVLVLPLIFVITALTVLVFAFGARRLLGLRFSFLRTLIAGGSDVGKPSPSAWMVAANFPPMYLCGS
ncbi:hypothetical protein [Trebonia sp.]|uniref:hypothetical protein n=1 Tax=Trebonia sp. TaxID=2767075 RepID=UPI003BAFCF29